MPNATLPESITATVQDFIHARIALDQLEDAIIQWSFDCHQWAPLATKTTLLDIEGALWRFSCGDTNLTHLKQQLADAIGAS